MKMQATQVNLPAPVAVAVVEPEECTLDEPEACEPQMVLSSTDKMLVKLGMKTEDECELQPEGENLMEKVKCAGRAGIISYILWEWAFWIGAGGVATVVVGSSRRAMRRYYRRRQRGERHEQR